MAHSHQLAPKMKAMMTFSIILTGFAAVVSQIIFVRELLIVFYGNELSLAFIFAGWLIGGATGGAILGRTAHKINRPGAVFAGCQLALSFALPLTVILIRSIKSFLGVNPGEIIAFFPMIVSSFILMVPVCAIMGYMFALACRLYESVRPGAASIGKVYVLESCGAIAGGTLASFVLVSLLHSVIIAGVLAILLAGSAALIFHYFARNVTERAYSVLAFGVCLAAVLAVPLGGWDKLDTLSLSRQTEGRELIASGNSIYGNVSVVRDGSQYSFFANGVHLYTVPDPQASEETVHFAMLEHPDPKNVLLIGAGAGGAVSEILKHRADRIDYVELDPLIIRMAQEYLPKEYRSALDDKRVSLRFEDGRLFIKRTTGTYDVVIVNLGDPYNAQLNRFYTAEFFDEVKRVLRNGGVLSFGLTSSESYMSKESRNFLRSIYRTLRASFADVKIIPGETAYFLASGRSGLLTYDHNVLTARARGRGLDLEYVREYYLPYRMASDKISFIERSIVSGATEGAINRDFRPISYYYDMVFWAARFKGSLFTMALKAMNAKRVLWAAAGVGALMLLLWFSGSRKDGGLRRGAAIAVLINGFSQMTLQLVVLLAFQVIYGFMFYKIGVIITAFMSGLTVGGLLGIRAVSRNCDERSGLMSVQAGLVFYPVILLPTFGLCSGAHSSLTAWVGSNIVFTVLPFVSGCMGGYIFPVANKVFLGDREQAGASGGFGYGMDLLGSCAGALLTGTLLIPILGIPVTCFVVAAGNAIALLVLLLSGKKAEKP